MSPLMDEQAARVTSLLYVPGGAGWGTPRRFGSTDAWLVLRGSEHLVLKPGRSEQDDADVTWEHAYLLRLSEAGFPTSVPVPAFDGQTWVRSDGRIWAALRYLPGQPLVAQPDPDMAAAGDFLARYYQLARTLPIAGQRPTAAELLRLREATRWDHLRAALGDAGTLGRFTVMLESLEAGLHTLKYAELEHLVIHGDATNDNLIVDGTPPRIVGLIDFGSAHLAPWICDLAAALWRSGRPDPNGVAYDPERLRQFVVGYHRVSPIPSALVCAIPLLMEGRGVQLISRRVRRLPQSLPVPAVLDALVRTEWLHTHRADLVEAIAGAPGEDAVAR